MKLLQKHWAFILVLCLATIPLFGDLGGDYLWADEGDTAVLALNVMKYGVPRAWDGTTFIDSDMGQRENADLVMVSHPWAQYYVTAASFWLLGDTPFAARFPFALAGWLTLAAVYGLSLRLLDDRRAALSAVILLAFSLQFLLFSRQCRNYALAMLFTCVLLLAFFRLKDRKTTLQFAAAGILLFHTHPSGVVPLATLGLLSLGFQPLRPYRKWFWWSAPLVALLTVPWFFLAKTGYEQNTTATLTLANLPARLTQFFIECASVTPVVGVIVIFIMVWVRHYRETRASQPTVQKFSIPQARQISHTLFPEKERTLILVICSLLLAYGLLIAVTQSRAEMWQLGLRQVAAIVPLTALLIGMLVSKLSRSRRQVWLVVMLLLTVTKLGRITPWSFLHEERTFLDHSAFAAMHVPKGWANKIFRTGLLAFGRELWRDNHGTDSQLCRFLKTNAAPDDILITNYAWEPLYFHTRLPQGLKILPEYPIYETARKHGLPEYVFTVQRARWVIWRHAWEGYQGYEWKKLLEAFAAGGARLEQVAVFPETLWENRENIHFRRFPGGDYKYGWVENAAPAEVFRVHWPEPNATPGTN